eukprot:3128177-Pyramimonas_sp.AAC.1
MSQAIIPEHEDVRVSRRRLPYQSARTLLVGALVRAEDVDHWEDQPLIAQLSTQRCATTSRGRPDLVHPGLHAHPPGAALERSNSSTVSGAEACSGTIARSGQPMRAELIAPACGRGTGEEKEGTSRHRRRRRRRRCRRRRRRSRRHRGRGIVGPR